MAVSTEDDLLRQAALAYVIELYDELTEENGAPTLGIQNQAVDVILADPELCRSVMDWAAQTGIGEATTAPPTRLRRDDLYLRVRACLEQCMGPPVFARSPQTGQ